MIAPAYVEVSCDGHCGLELKITPDRGRGVFVIGDIETGDSIEISPMLAISKEDCEWIDETDLSRYRYELLSTDDDGNPEIIGLIALGYGSLYNHSFDPNADYEIENDVDGNFTIEFFAIKPILDGEEVTINYNGSPADQTALDALYGISGGIEEVCFAGGGFYCSGPGSEGTKTTMDKDEVTCVNCREAVVILIRALHPEENVIEKVVD